MITEPSPRMVLPENMRDVAQLARHRLHDDFLGVEDAVDDDAEGLAADLRDDDEAVLVVDLGAVVDLRAASSRWISGSSLLRSRSTGVSLMRSMRCSEFGARAHQFDHRRAAEWRSDRRRLDDQRRDDGERQRNLDGEARAFARHRLHVDRAADLVDVGAHHVHADAAAGDVGDLGCGREARREDELVDLRFASSSRARPRSTRPFAIALRLDRARCSRPRPSSAMLDDDVAAFVIGGEADRALLRLAGGAALARASRGRDRPSCAPCASADP